MILPFNKFGFCIKDIKDKADFIKSKRYFYISPSEKRIYFTRNQKMLKSTIYSSENEEEIINKLKIMESKNMKLSEKVEIDKVKEISKPIHPTISAKQYFEMRTKGKIYLIFSFFSEEIWSLRETFKKAIQKACAMTQLPILELLQPHTCNNKEVLFKFGQKYRVITEMSLFSSDPLKVVKKDENSDFVELSNGSMYNGEILNERPHGNGSEFRQDGITYKGEFHDGKWHGVGMILMPTLEIWEGDFIDGFPVSL